MRGFTPPAPAGAIRESPLQNHAPPHSGGKKSARPVKHFVSMNYDSRKGASFSAIPRMSILPGNARLRTRAFTRTAPPTFPESPSPVKQARLAMTDKNGAAEIVGAIHESPFDWRDEASQTARDRS